MSTDPRLTEFSSEELLYELIQRNGVSIAAISAKRIVPHIETLVGIGEDDTATIVLADESYEVLEERMENPEGYGH